MLCNKCLFIYKAVKKGSLLLRGKNDHRDYHILGKTNMIVITYCQCSGTLYIFKTHEMTLKFKVCCSFLVCQPLDCRDFATD